MYYAVSINNRVYYHIVIIIFLTIPYTKARFFKYVQKWIHFCIALLIAKHDKILSGIFIKMELYPVIIMSSETTWQLNAKRENEPLIKHYFS